MSLDIDNEILKHMPLDMALQLAKIYKHIMGIDLETISKSYIQHIEKVIKKKKNSNAFEYDLLLTYADEITNNPKKDKDLQEVNNL